MSTYSPLLVSLCRTRNTPWEPAPPASTSCAALSRESIPWNQGCPERGWSPSPPSDSPWNRNDPSGRREGGKPGCQGGLPRPGREAALLSRQLSLPLPWVRSLRILRPEFREGGPLGLEADAGAHLCYLRPFPECPGAGRGLRGGERCPQGAPLQWGCGGATLGGAVPWSQSGRRQWRRSWGRWTLRAGPQGPRRPLEQGGRAELRTGDTTLRAGSQRAEAPAPFLGQGPVAPTHDPGQAPGTEGLWSDEVTPGSEWAPVLSESAEVTATVAGRADGPSRTRVLRSILFRPTGQNPQRSKASKTLLLLIGPIQPPRAPRLVCSPRASARA